MGSDQGIHREEKIQSLKFYKKSNDKLQRYNQRRPYCRKF